MELRSVDELMDLLLTCRGTRVAAHGGGRPVDAHDHALRTAALLRRRRPADKEIQVAGLVHAIGPVLRPGGDGHTAMAAGAVRELLGERVAALVRRQGEVTPQLPLEDDVLTLRQASQEARTPGAAGDGTGVLEDWRPVLELVAARNAGLRTVD